MKALTGGKGVQIIGLKDDETMTQVETIAGTRIRITGQGPRGKVIDVASEDVHCGHRARRGALVGNVRNIVLAG